MMSNFMIPNSASVHAAVSWCWTCDREYCSFDMSWLSCDCVVRVWEWDRLEACGKSAVLLCTYQYIDKQINNLINFFWFIIVIVIIILVLFYFVIDIFAPSSLCSATESPKTVRPPASSLCCSWSGKSCPKRSSPVDPTRSCCADCYEAAVH